MHITDTKGVWVIQFTVPQEDDSIFTCVADKDIYTADNVLAFFDELVAADTVDAYFFFDGDDDLPAINLDVLVREKMESQLADMTFRIARDRG